MAPLPLPGSRARRMAVVALLLAVAGALAGVSPAVAAGGSGSVQTSRHSVAAHGWRLDMLARVNEVRAAAGVHPLRLCAALGRSAQGYADLMAGQDYYGHVGPDGSEPWDRMRSQGYAWRNVGENIAAGQRDGAAVMAAWIASADHYANLVNPRFRHVGFGHAAAAGSRYGTYWVQNFGRGRGC